MFIRHIFVVKPMIAIAILVCMGTLVALFKMNRRRPQNKSDRFLIAFIGLLTIYEAFKIMRNAGVVSVSTNGGFDDALELLVAMTCLVAAILLRVSHVDHLTIESAVRLARAAPPSMPRHEPSVGPKDASTLETLGWAIPKVSDGAFKLLAVLCLRTDAPHGRVSAGVVDIQIKLGKSRDEMERCLRELEEAGIISLRRSGTNLDMEILGPAHHSAAHHIEALRRPALVTGSQL